MFILSLHVRIRIFAPVLSRLRPAVVPSRPVRAEKTQLIGRFRYTYIYIYIYISFSFLDSSQLYTRTSIRVAQNISSRKFEIAAFALEKNFVLRICLPCEFQRSYLGFFFLAYLNSYKEIESCENSR